ncbi:hypothetical protein CCMA1212_002818 [Trichoderma ghanense]|uniref:Uncharacterized protein n=1 Tax=Trichoderma ghanense TaxID=65468 RepID=A0ABY2HEW9_9HYPO
MDTLNQIPPQQAGSGLGHGLPCEGGFTLTTRVAAVRGDWAQAGRPWALQLAGQPTGSLCLAGGGQSAPRGLSASSLDCCAVPGQVPDQAL